MGWRAQSGWHCIKMPGGILALDASSSAVGWAYGDPGAPMPLWDTFRPKLDGETAKEHAGRIGARFAIFLEARIEVLKPTHIVREQPYAGGKRWDFVDGKKVLVDIPVNNETMFPLWGLAWQIDTIAEQHGIDCRQCTTLAAVKFFTGRAKYENREAKKRATVAMCKMHGWKCTEDEADALAILVYAEAKLFPEMRLAMRRLAGPLFAEKRA
jgi:hypothetical protein